MSRTTMYLIGGAVVVGGYFYLKTGSPFPLSTQAKAKQTSGGSVSTQNLGVAMANVGARTISLLDKIIGNQRATAQAAAFVQTDGGPGIYATNGNFGPDTPDNPFGTG